MPSGSLTSAGVLNLGGVSKFSTIDLAAGNSTVTVTNTTLSSGKMSLLDGASGNNTVSAASDTSASTGKSFLYYTGPGTDSFTGGFENDSVRVSAAAVGGDTLTGGSGGNGGAGGEKIVQRREITLIRTVREPPPHPRIVLAGMGPLDEVVQRA